MKIQMKGIEVNELPYERREMKHLVRLLKNPKTIIDVGANIGWYSIMLAKLYPKCDVYAFEPMPETYDMLFRNIYENDLVSQIYTFNVALSDETSKVEFAYYPNFPGASSMRKNIKGKSIKVVVDAYPLKNYFFDSIDLIKIDTEGSELYVLKGAELHLKKHHPLVMCEMMRKWTHNFGYHPNDIIKYMKGLGYKCYAMGRCLKLIKKVTDKTEETNFIFSKKEIKEVK